MTTEYHVFTDIQENQEHAFIFEIEREEHYLDAKELWIINITNGNEIHMRINLQQLFDKMATKIGGNIEDSDVPTIMSLLDDVLDSKKQLEVSIELTKKTIQKLDNSEGQQLILAGDLSAKLSDESLIEMAKNLNNQ